MADLPSILGGMAQGFLDFGKSAVDLFGTGGASIADLIESARTGKVTTRNSDDFRKWLYDTNDVKDAAAKGLGTALNGVQTVSDYMPGIGAVTRNPLFNAGQGALGGLADEFKTYGKDYDLARAGQRAAVSAGSALAGSGLAEALKGSNNAILKSSLAQGAARGGLGGAITGGGYAAIDGGDAMQGAIQGAKMGALIGGATGAIQDFKPAKTYDVALTDDERAARIANAQKQIDDIGPVSRFSNNPDDIAKRARITELQDAIKAYQSGYDTTQDYTDAMAAKRANRANTQSATTTQGQVYAPNMGEMEYGAPVQDGYTRLYRGMTQEFDPQYNRNAMDNMNGYESWTDNYDLANRYGAGKYVYSIDVPTSRIANSLFDENPNSATYGNRNFISAIDKAAGLDGVDGNEYLLNTNDELRSGLTYNRVNAPKALETTLSDADMAVNSARLTPEQEAYFKDSVIRDENGNLMPLYHGSNSKFTVFDSSKSGQSNKTAKVGHWFTPSEEGARNFANSVWYGDESEPTVYSTYLNVKNPKIYEAVDNSAQIKALNDEMDNLTRQLDGMRRGSDDFNATYKTYNDLAKQIDNLSYGDPYEQFRSDIYAMEGKTPYQANVGGLGMMMDDENAATQKYVQSLRDQGYDGIIIRGTDYDNGTLGGTNDQYVVFDSNQIKDINNLKPTDAPSLMESRITPEELDLARALSDQDLLVNNAKIAPGQLGLFDDMPTQTPKTGTRQTSLFDQPQEGVSEPVNPYAPVDGKLTQAMKDRYWEVMKNADSFGGAIDNELYNKIDQSTLPKGYDKLRQLLDSQMGEDSKVAVELRKGIGTDIPLRADLDKLVEYVYGDEINGKQTFYKDLDESVRLNRKNAPLIGIDAEQAEADARNSARNKLISRAIEKAERKVIDDVVGSGDSDDILYALQDYRRRGVRTGRAGALDTVLSERLGIAPGNTVKVTNVTDSDRLSSGALGRYARSERNIAVSDMNSPEGKVSTMAHERLHSFQNEARPESAGRYDPEVAEAYKQLQKDLGHYYKSNSEIKKRYKRDVDYWASSGEQESRMFQQYLENKGYTDNSAWRKMGGKADEWGNEINPAFDKFIDKLRDLSKRGVALPALTALFGGGALMANQQKDKEEVR